MKNLISSKPKLNLAVIGFAASALLVTGCSAEAHFGTSEPMMATGEAHTTSEPAATRSAQASGESRMAPQDQDKVPCLDGFIKAAIDAGKLTQTEADFYPRSLFDDLAFSMSENLGITVPEFCTYVDAGQLTITEMHIEMNSK